MTFSYIAKYLTEGKAAKTPTMLGYVYRNDFTPAAGDTWTSRYKLLFRERSDDGDFDGDKIPVYAFTFTTEANGTLTVEAPDNPLVIDPELIQHLMSEDWDIYEYADLEKARSGTSLRW